MAVAASAAIEKKLEKTHVHPPALPVPESTEAGSSPSMAKIDDEPATNSAISGFSGLNSHSKAGLSTSMALSQWLSLQILLFLLQHRLLELRKRNLRRCLLHQAKETEMVATHDE
ncbi:hypothetical protein Bca52824_095427 [Brassica carinata]|uniref:Uncharacterized protein n=1 Tax=Brassica carinata TaxID=52824 RepID=A0A8X7P3F0_BRACI|nr:hypothetical protein Bca52824_095427 [Brassica carinata]